MAELDLIRNSSSYVHDKHPELVQLLKKQESDFSPKTVAEAIDHNISGALKFGKSGKESQDPEEPILEPMLTVLDFGILQIFELTYVFMRHSHRKPAISWRFKHKHASAPEPIDFYFAALTHIYKTLRSIRMLLQKGFDAQARVLGRSYIETAELLLAASGSSEVFKQFFDYSHEDEQETESDRLTFWFKHLSPKKIRKRIIRLLEEEGLDRESAEDLARSFQNTYQLLSETTHPSWRGMMFGTYAVRSNSNMVEAALGGKQSDLSQLTINLIIDHLFIFLKMLIYLLAKKHQWRLLSSDKENLRFVFQQKVFEHLYLSLKPAIRSMIDDTFGILVSD